MAAWVVAVEGPEGSSFFNAGYTHILDTAAVVDIGGITLPVAVPLKQETFARIPLDICKAVAGCRPTGDTSPVDQYSNGIADTWELQQASRYLDQAEDQEIGWPGSSTRGDGYSAHDEYRGFLVWNGQDLVHVRTDPVGAKDVFYDDQAGLASSAIRGNILENAMGPYIKFWQITDTAANFDPARATTQSVFQHNRNTITNSIGFAMVYVNADLGGTCGRAIGNLNIKLGNSGTLQNDGTVPLKIDTDQISACSPLLSFPGAVMLAQVVAHETGHKLGLSHPFKSVPYQLVLPSAISTLQQTNYTADEDNNLIYTWLEDYLYGTGRKKADGIILGPGVLGNNIEDGTVTEIASPNPVYRPVSADQAVFQFNFQNPLAKDSITGIPYRLYLSIQERHIMDWTPRLTLQTAGEWTFNPAHLTQACPKASCP